MKSFSIKTGVGRSILMLGGLFIGVRILVSLLEEVALLLAFYLA